MLLIKKNKIPGSFYSYLVNRKLQFISCCSRSGRIDALIPDVLQTWCRKVFFVLHTLVRAAERRVYNCNALEFTKNFSL